MDTAKTTLPTALILGLTCPCNMLSTRTGSVSFTPPTKNAIMNSSKDTAAVRKSAAKIAGRVKGRMT